MTGRRHSTMRRRADVKRSQGSNGGVRVAHYAPSFCVAFSLWTCMEFGPRYILHQLVSPFGYVEG